MWRNKILKVTVNICHSDITVTSPKIYDGLEEVHHIGLRNSASKRDRPQSMLFESNSVITRQSKRPLIGLPDDSVNAACQIAPVDPVNTVQQVAPSHSVPMNSQRTNNFDRESTVSEDADGSDLNEGSYENFANENNLDSSSFHEEASRLNRINSLTKGNN